MPKTEKQRLRRKLKARAQRLHPPDPQLATLIDPVGAEAAELISRIVLNREARP